MEADVGRLGLGLQLISGGLCDLQVTKTLQTRGEFPGACPASPRSWLDMNTRVPYEAMGALSAGVRALFAGVRAVPLQVEQCSCVGSR